MPAKRASKPIPISFQCERAKEMMASGSLALTPYESHFIRRAPDRIPHRRPAILYRLPHAHSTESEGIIGASSGPRSSAIHCEGPFAGVK